MKTTTPNNKWGYYFTALLSMFDITGSSYASPSPSRPTDAEALASDLRKVGSDFPRTVKPLNKV